MSYKLNLPGMFCVPDAVADEHLKLARELELKVLLWLCRHGEHQGIEALAAWLGKPQGDLVNAVQFWIDRGVLFIDNEQATATANNEVTKKAQPLPEIAPARPNQAQILTRVNEDENLRALFAEADKILERTIGHEGQCMLLVLHDSFGLPSEVIYMLLRYCKQIGKTNNAYVEAVGRDWGQREIDTLEKADAQIEQLKANLGLWNALKQRTGIQTPKPSSTQHEFLRRWSGEMGFDIEMIHLAYDEAAERTGKLSFSYMNKVLEGWHTAGTKTPAQAAAAKEQFRQKRAPAAQKKVPKGAAAPTGHAPSFDLAAFEQSTFEVPIWEGEK